MDADEKARRVEEFGKQVRERQQADDHDSPFPSFLNVVTEAIVDMKYRIEQIEQRLGDWRG